MLTLACPRDARDIFATGVAEVAAGDYRYCIQGDVPVVRVIKAGKISLAEIFHFHLQEMNHRRSRSNQAKLSVGRLTG